MALTPVKLNLSVNLIGMQNVGRGYFSIALRAAFVLAVFVYLIHEDLLSLESLRAAITNWPWMLAGWVCMLLTTLVSIARWHFLIRAQGLPMPVRRTFQAAFIGLFFNVFLPGSMSGDLVKGYYIVRAVPGRIAAAVSSIIFDRVVGLSGLIIIAVLGLFAASLADWNVTLGPAVILAVIGLGCAVSAFFIALLAVSEHRDPFLLILEHRSVPAFLKRLTSVYRGIRSYHNQRFATLAALLATVVAQSLFVVGWLCYVRAMAIEGIPLFALFVMVPIGMLVAAIPIAPAGIGTGHAAFLAIFAMLGSDRGADLFNLLLVFQFAQAAVGGVVYLLARSRPIDDALVDRSGSG